MSTPAGSSPATSAVTNAVTTPATARVMSSGGRTQIADVVVSKIAGLAAREIAGVYALGGGVARAFGAIRERIPGGSTNVSQGVGVEVGEKQAAVDLDIVIEYGASVADVAVAIRRNVIGALERMTGLEVVEVNIAVNDVHLPGDDEHPEPAAAPVAPRVS